MSKQLTGTIVPLVTPFREDETCDEAAMVCLVEWILTQDASALMPTALTGEGPLLDTDETLKVWDSVFEAAGGQVPVVPAIISTTTRRALALVESAQARGAAAVMVAPVLPELYAGRSHDDVCRFYADVARATTLPIVLFNYPSLTSIDFTHDLVARLLEIDTVRYIKESTGDVRRVHALHRRFGDRLSVICGAPNVALEALALGCHAWITGILNAVPRSGAQLMHAVEEGDLPLARRIYYGQILPLVDVMLGNNNPTGTIKAAVTARPDAIDVGAPRRPGSPIDPATLTELMSTIADAEVAHP